MYEIGHLNDVNHERKEVGRNSSSDYKLFLLNSYNYITLFIIHFQGLFLLNSIILLFNFGWTYLHF